MLIYVVYHLSQNISRLRARIVVYNVYQLKVALTEVEKFGKVGQPQRASNGTQKRQKSLESLLCR